MKDLELDKDGNLLMIDDFHNVAEKVIKSFDKPGHACIDFDDDFTTCPSVPELTKLDIEEAISMIRKEGKYKIIIQNRIVLKPIFSTIMVVS